MEKFGVEIPFVHHLGFELVLFEGGQSRIDYEPKPEHLNSFDVTHGGACMTLLDVTMAVAARSVAKDMGVVTIEMKTTFMQPYFGLGVNFSHVAAAEVDTLVYAADFGFPYRSATQFQLINNTIQQFRTEASPIAILGTQLRFPFVSVFGHVSATTATDNFLLAAPGGRGFRLSFEAGARYNIGSSIDRMR